MSHDSLPLSPTEKTFGGVTVPVQSKERPSEEILVEALAKYAHDAWSGWMKYQIGRSKHEFLARWIRQMNTEYKDLPEEEKESDRAEARKILALVGQWDIPSPPDLICALVELFRAHEMYGEEDNFYMADMVRRLAREAREARGKKEAEEISFVADPPKNDPICFGSGDILSPQRAAENDCETCVCASKCMEASKR